MLPMFLCYVGAVPSGMWVDVNPLCYTYTPTPTMPISTTPSPELDVASFHTEKLSTIIYLHSTSSIYLHTYTYT